MAVRYGPRWMITYGGVQYPIDIPDAYSDENSQQCFADGYKAGLSMMADIINSHPPDIIRVGPEIHYTGGG